MAAARVEADCHGKEGVAGSSPAEGSREPPQMAAFLFAEMAARGRETFVGRILGRIRTKRRPGNAHAARRTGTSMKSVTAGQARVGRQQRTGSSASASASAT